MLTDGSIVGSFVGTREMLGLDDGEKVGILVGMEVGGDDLRGAHGATVLFADLDLTNLLLLLDFVE